jgi:4-amino-4-deoxy-L-arabinose transferase-like glycosyltransferase
MAGWMRRKWLVVVAIAVVVRIAVLLLFGPSLFFYEQTGQIHGSTAYDEYAINLLQTGVYGREAGVPDANIAPLYSYVVAAVYATVGRSGLAIGLLHTLFDALSIVLVYWISLRLFRQGEFAGQPIGEWVGAGAGLFTALYPYLVFQNLTLNDTALFILLMHAFIYLMILLREQPDTKRAVLLALAAGCVLGVTTLVRALLPLFALLTALWFLFRMPLLRAFWRLALVALVSLLVLVPWIIRNQAVYHTFVPVALNTGDNLFQGANDMTVPLFRAGYDAQWSDPPANSIRGDVFRNNNILIEAGLAYYRAYPERIAELLWVKFLVHWSIEITPRLNPQDGQSFALDEQGNLLVLDNPDADKQDIETLSQYSSGLFDRVARPLHVVYFGSLFLLALAGMLLTARQWRDVALLWFLQFSMTFMYMLFHPSTRYRSPTDPLLFAFAAYALLWLIQRVRHQRAQE